MLSRRCHNFQPDGWIRADSQLTKTATTTPIKPDRDPRCRRTHAVPASPSE
jgi:hypothetical protein